MLPEVSSSISFFKMDDGSTIKSSRKRIADIDQIEEEVIMKALDDYNTWKGQDVIKKIDVKAEPSGEKNRSHYMSLCYVTTKVIVWRLLFLQLRSIRQTNTTIER